MEILIFYITAVLLSAYGATDRKKAPGTAFAYRRQTGAWETVYSFQRQQADAAKKTRFP